MSERNEGRAAATPREIWAILREVSESQRETDRRMQETERLFKQQAADADRRAQETDRRMQETERLFKQQAADADRRAQETDRRLRELDKLFNGQWGKLMEALVDGDLIELLNGRGIEVDHTMTNVVKRSGGQRRREVDILALNGDEVVAVEVKTTLKVRDVDRYLSVLEGFGKVLPKYRDRKVYGAVAYLRADESSDEYAEGRGLFVIRATGSSASITNPEDFTPRVFGRQAVTDRP